MLLQPSYKSGYGVGYRSDVPISVQKVLYPTVLFLEGTLNDTNHCEVIIYSQQ